MPELVLYGIRLLAKQFLGTVLDIDVDHSASLLSSSRYPPDVVMKDGRLAGARRHDADVTGIIICCATKERKCVICDKIIV